MDNIQDPQAPSHATVCSLRHPASSQSSSPNTLSRPLSPNSPSHNSPSHNSPSHNSPSARSSTSHDRLNDVVLLGKPAAALTTGDTSYDPGSPLHDIYSAPATRGHQKSFSTTLLDNCRPLVHRATSSISSLKDNSRAPAHSPLSASHTPDDDEEEERRPQTAHRDPSKANALFGDWFNGNSGPVNLGFKPRAAHDNDDDSHSDSSSDIGSDSDISDTPSPNLSDPFDRMDPISTDAPSTAPTMTSHASLPRNTPRHSPAPSTASKISTWFSRASVSNASAHARHTSHASRASLTADPLLHLDIQHALFPHGAPDPLDPASFNDLLLTSTKLLQQYQSAYRGLSAVVRDARAEQSASRDEADEADTRARHLKMQLDGMAAKAAEQDQAMRLLAAELAEERTRRAEDEEARARSLRLVKQGAGCSCSGATTTNNPNRRSTDATSVSDSGFESDSETALESSSSSVFSATEQRQPSGPRQRGLSQAEVLEREIEALCTPRQTANRAPDTQTTPKSSRATPAPQQPPPSWKPGHAKRPSALDKVLGRKVSTSSAKSGPGYLGDVRGSQMDVWRENRELRDRVGELERSVDESLRVLGGFGF